jgi:hypothetical protein
MEKDLIMINISENIIISLVTVGGTLLGGLGALIVRFSPIKKTLKEFGGNLRVISEKQDETHNLLLDHITRDESDRKFFYEMNLEYKNFLPYCRYEKCRRFALALIQKFQAVVWRIYKEEFKPEMLPVYLDDLKKSRDELIICAGDILNDRKFGIEFLAKTLERNRWFDRDLEKLIAEEKRNAKRLKFARMCPDYIRDVLGNLDELWEEYKGREENGRK